MTRKTLLLLFLLSLYMPGWSQARWNFRQCLDTALRRNLTVNQARLSNEVDKINMEQDKAARYPSLSANVNEGLNFGKNVDVTTNTFVTESFNSTNVSVNSGFNLFNGFQARNNIRQSELNLKAGALDIEKTKNDVTLNVTAAYLQVLFQYEILETARQQTEATAVQVNRTEKMVNAGRLPETDLLQIKAQHASDKLAVVIAENQLQIAKVNLMQLMEIPILDTFDIEKPILAEPAMEKTGSNEEVYKRSLEVQPQVGSAALRTSSALMGIKIYEGSRWPRLNLSANLNSNYASSRFKGSQVNSENYPFTEQLWDNLGQSFGLSLSIPIYSNRQIKSNIERARITALSTQLDEQNVKNQLRKTIEQYYTDLISAYKKYEAVQEQLLNSEASYNNQQKKFDVGLSTAIDFLIEKNSFYQAQSNLIQARYDYFFKMKMLDFYQGKPILF